jgi:hypothetical protein
MINKKIYYSHYYKNSMSKKDWDIIDRSSRIIFKDFLRRHYNDNIKQISDIKVKSANDLMVLRKDNKKILFELKDRRIPHNKFSDIMIEVGKEQSLKYKEHDKIFIVSFYNDDYMAICELLKEKITYNEKWCPNQSMIIGANQFMINKPTVHLP